MRMKTLHLPISTSPVLLSLLFRLGGNWTYTNTVVYSPLASSTNLILSLTVYIDFLTGLTEVVPWTVKELRKGLGYRVHFFLWIYHHIYRHLHSVSRRGCRCLWSDPLVRPEFPSVRRWVRLYYPPPTGSLKRKTTRT